MENQEEEAELKKLATLLNSPILKEQVAVWKKQRDVLRVHFRKLWEDCASAFKVFFVFVFCVENISPLKSCFVFLSPSLHSFAFHFFFSSISFFFVFFSEFLFLFCFRSF